MLRVDIEKLPSYEIGYEDGEEKGIEKDEKQTKIEIDKD